MLVGGLVIHRQRPATASGITFVNLEDETGMLNVVISVEASIRSGRVIRSHPALMVRGTLEKADGVINLVAEKIVPLTLPVTSRSRLALTHALFRHRA